MASLSICCKKPRTRTKLGKMACSSCGRYSEPLIIKKQQEEPLKREIPKDDFADDRITWKEPDDRDTIRHLKSYVKFTACGRR